MKLEATSIPGIATEPRTDGKTSFYGKFRHPIKKTSTRKKIFTKDKNLKKYALEARKLLDKYILTLKETKTNESQENITFKDYTLNELADMYFKDRIAYTTRKLRQYYSHLSNEEFQDDKTIQRKIYNSVKSASQYNVNVKNKLLTEAVLVEINSNEYDLKTKFGELKIKDINRRVVTKYLHSILGETLLSTKSKFNIISQLKTIYNWGNTEDIIDLKNPLEHLKMKNPKHQRERVLNNEELKLLLETAKKRYGVFSNVYLSFYLGVLTAARKTTVLNIRKKDIDIKNKVIHLTNYKAANRSYKVPINKEATKWFKDKLLPRYANKNECIIKSEILQKDNIDNLQAMSRIPTNAMNLFDELFNENYNKRNNRERDFVVNFHTLRRSRATNLIRNKIATVYDVMKLLDHSSIKQTEEYLNLGSEILENAQINDLNLIFNCNHSAPNNKNGIKVA